VRNNAPIFNHVIPAVISLKFTLVANCRRLISFAAVGPDHNLNIGQLRGEQRNRMMTLPVFEFLRRILQHMLPPRLQKIRYYDFLSSRSNIDLDDLRAVILESLRDAEPDLELEDCRVPPLSQKGTSHHRETSWPAKVPRVETDQNRARSPSTPTETPSCRVRFCRNFPMCKSTQPSRSSTQAHLTNSPQIKKARAQHSGFLNTGFRSVL
jgi:hypothetical protein